MNLNHTSSEQPQIMQQQLHQQEHHIEQLHQQQQLYQQQQLMPQLLYPTQLTGYGPPPPQINYCPPTLEATQPNQQAQTSTNYPATKQLADTHENANGTKTQFKWQTIKKRKRNTPTSEEGASRPPISCSNRYEQLSQLPNDFTDDAMHTDAITNTQPIVKFTSPKDPKPPPIFVYGVINFNDMAKYLSKTIAEDQYYCKVQSNDTIKIYVSTPDSYRRIVKQLQDDKIVYHTYQLKQERAYRIVIRNLHHSTPTTQITTELEKRGHEVRNILNVKHRATKEPLPLFFIDLEPKENNKTIYDIEFLCNMRITVEAPRQRKHIVQCTRCQSYGHTKTYCTKPYACVKCGENHNTTTCTKPSDTPAKCALCGGSHPASYKGCEVYKNLQKIRGKSLNQTPYRTAQQNISINDRNQFPPINPNQVTTPMPFTPTTSYAQALTQKQQPPMDEQLSTFLSELKTLFTQLLNQNSMILSLLHTVIGRITTTA
jgi:hypothetical protein